MSTVLESIAVALEALNPTAKKIIIASEDEKACGIKENVFVMKNDFDIDDTLSLIGDVRYVGIINAERFNGITLSSLINILTTYNKVTVVCISNNPISCNIFYPIPEIGTTHIHGNYEYSYKQQFSLQWVTVPEQLGWGIRVINNTQTDYENPLTMIHGYPVTSMAYLFNSSSQKRINLIDWDTSHITDMSCMFRDSQAASLDLSGFDTSMVTDMSYMFYYSQSLRLDLSNFNTSNVIDMSNMFGRSHVTNLDLSSFNTSKVTNMQSMFHTGNVTILDLSNFNTSNTTDMTGMFFDSKTMHLDVSNFDTSSADTSWMFAYSQLELLDLSSFSISERNKALSMFTQSNCKYITARTELDSNKYKTSDNFPVKIIVTVKA